MPKSDSKIARPTRTKPDPPPPDHDEVVPGVARLQAWMAANHVNTPRLAALLGRSIPVVRGWLIGENRPDAIGRLRIKRLTAGEVSTMLWLTERERRELEALRPYAPDPLDVPPECAAACGPG